MRLVCACGGLSPALPPPAFGRGDPQSGRSGPVSAGVEAGALGARMTGGGFGGSAIVLVEESAA
ncbi:hypothetical protein, partial [Actinacidiphila glaucinigra]|uniref:hypothetical protein n=1 Tax=Actinacidiphila glaucinigra TaxID=235986 RepID=UPI0035E0EFF1